MRLSSYADSGAWSVYHKIVSHAARHHGTIRYAAEDTPEMLATFVVLASVTFDDPPPPSRFVDERRATLEVAETYIRARNLTLLEVDLGSVRMAESGLLQLSVQAIYTGKGRGGPRLASLHLITRWGETLRYRDDHAVTLRVDGEPIALKADN
jgi:hypothetical protein